MSLFHHMILHYVYHVLDVIRFGGHTISVKDKTRALKTAGKLFVLFVWAVFSEFALLCKTQRACVYTKTVTSPDTRAST